MLISLFPVLAPSKASSQNGNGYDIYDLYDLGEFDQKGGKATKWGTKEEYLQCIKVAKENGVVVYVDAVLNHKAGADDKEKFLVTEVKEDDRTEEVSDLVSWHRSRDDPELGANYALSPSVRH